MVSSAPSVKIVESKVQLKSFSNHLEKVLPFITLKNNVQWYFGTIRSTNDHFVNINPTTCEAEKEVMIKKKSTQNNLSFTGFTVCELTANVSLNETVPGFNIEFSRQTNILKNGTPVIFSLKEDKQGKTVIKNFALFSMESLSETIKKKLADRDLLCTIEMDGRTVNKVNYHFEPNMDVLLVSRGNQSPTLSSLADKIDQKSGFFYKVGNTTIKARDVCFSFDERGHISDMSLEIPLDFGKLFEEYVKDLI